MSIAKGVFSSFDMNRLVYPHEKKAFVTFILDQHNSTVRVTSMTEESSVEGG